MITPRSRLFAFVSFVVVIAAGSLHGQVVDKGQAQKAKDQPGLDLTALMAKPHNEMAIVSLQFTADLGNLTRFYNITVSPTRFARLRRFYGDWLKALDKVDSTKLSKPAQADLDALRKRIQRDLAQTDAEATAQAEIAPLMPFARIVIALAESRQKMDRVDGMKAATALNTLKQQIQLLRKGNVAPGKAKEGDKIEISKAFADRAADSTATLRTALGNWYKFYNGYDPAFTWWAAELYKEVDKALGDYATFVRGKGARTAVATAMPALPTWAIPGDTTNTRPAAFPVTEADAPDLVELVARKPSELRDVMAKFQADRGGKGGMGGGKGGGAKGSKLFDLWMPALAKIDFDKLSREGQVDYLLIKHSFERDVRRAEVQKKSAAALATLLPFEPVIDKMEQAVRNMDKVDAREAVTMLAGLRAAIEEGRAASEAAWKVKDSTHPIFANRISVTAAIDEIKALRASLTKWVAFGSTDAEFAKAVAAPAQNADARMEEYANVLRTTQNIKADPSGINGRPIGRDALMAELFAEMIGQTPEELLQIADKEYAWCEAEMKKASREMGFGDNWLQAVEKVKTLHVPPGGQPAMIRDLAWEAIDYLKKAGSITVPSIAQETWRMEMMTPERQLITPFFTGGETISVSYPTNTMAFDARLQSMRGNNDHFSRATCHHELIPGHHLQMFMAKRFSTHRSSFSTPFYIEGWALYWEFVLYEQGFPKKAEDRIGFLFWRMHRCARIHFSLNYHMGKWNAQECIDYLVKKVGHERDNATAEVRRSFTSNYGPLYQAAYMLGGKQIWALRKELVKSGKMNERAFHDAIMQGGNMPIEMVRALITDRKLSRDFKADWKFAE